MTAASLGSAVGTVLSFSARSSRSVLGEHVGDGEDTEDVRTEDCGQSAILKPPLEHMPHRVGRQGPGESCF